MQLNSIPMIEVKPKAENYFICPECKSDFPAINDVLIRSVHVMADCTCKQCGLQFYQVFPIGHNVADQLSVSKTDNRFYRASATETWLFDSLVKAHNASRADEVKVEKIVFKDC